MDEPSHDQRLRAFVDGRTDLVFDLFGPGSLPEVDGLPPLQLCAYFGDVTAIRFLLAQGSSLRPDSQPMSSNLAGHPR